MFDYFNLMAAFLCGAGVVLTLVWMDYKNYVGAFVTFILTLINAVLTFIK